MEETKTNPETSAEENGAPASENDSQKEGAPSFRLEKFDGPLDLLLMLIARHKLDIYDIPIAVILEQYLDYLEKMKEADMSITSEFIVMACELLYIKSKMLLPREEKPEEDPRKGLVESLIEYSRIKAAALFLAGREPLYYKRYYASPKPFVTVIEQAPMSADALTEAMSGMRIAVSLKKDVLKRKNVADVFAIKPISVEEKIIYLLRRMVRAVKYGNSVSFSGIFADSRSKRDSVATFLAMLELVSTGRLSYKRTENDYILTLNTEKDRGESDVPAGNSSIIYSSDGEN